MNKNVLLKISQMVKMCMTYSISQLLDKYILDCEQSDECIDFTLISFL